MKLNKKIIISIGSFNFVDIQNILNNNKNKMCYIEAYDPLESIYLGYCKLVKQYPGRLVASNKAVSSELKAGIALLNKKSTKSTICSVLPGKGSKFSFKGAPVSVPVISINSILDRFESIDELHLNCEGSEIPIIMETDLAIFKKCKFIKVQFHDFVPFLNITKEDVNECLKKWEPGFTYKRIGKGSTTYKFMRKDIP